jgi:sorbitol-specific phosphotransferase system component IIBC
MKRGAHIRRRRVATVSLPIVQIVAATIFLSQKVATSGPLAKYFRFEIYTLGVGAQAFQLVLAKTTPIESTVSEVSSAQG